MLNKNKKSPGLLPDDFDDLSFEEQEHHLAGEKLEVVKKILLNLRTNIDRAIGLLEEGYHGKNTLVLDKLEEIKNGIFDETEGGARETVEGVFDGQKMIGADGKEYQMPANYASKSKLVEGDILKLTIDNLGNFIYKQIGPIDRKRIKARLVYDETTRQYLAILGPKRWKLLTAAVTYFHGEAGDEVIILIPKDSKSQWAAVENMVKKD